MDQQGNKRQYERIAVSLPAKFSVLIPEHTFRPTTNDCEVIDLSERGAMINVRMSPASYSQMLQKTRYCRLGFEGNEQLPDKITGRAVWLQPQGNDEHRTYRIGLFFEDCPAEVVSALKAFVDKLKKTKVDASR